ncbi:hypothetical protein Bca52824_034978 [Brassica carinata]|uniref:Uncharacterized protein n=1 Tax=Brassica carinata TaxID=52824 RepID=A0A8X7V3P3_BRACI|nr:hypothetical protein Bca52824_034978 [Brassica carinata]
MDNHSIRVLARSKSKAELIFPGNDRIINAKKGEWRDCVQGSTAVVNLPISTRWSPEVTEKKVFLVCNSMKVVELINSSPVEARPTVSKILTDFKLSGISETGLFDGNSPSANDYLSEVCREWEGTALKANKDARVALIRKRWWGFSHDDTLFPNVCWRTSGFRTTLVKLNTSGFRTMRPSLNHSIKELSMGLRQTRLGFADGYQFLTLHSKLCSEKVPLWFLKDRRSYL